MANEIENVEAVDSLESEAGVATAEPVAAKKGNVKVVPTNLRESSKRSDLRWVDPGLIYLKPENNSRWQMPPLEEIHGLAVSMLTHGQQQPIVIRKQGNDYHVNSGYNRLTAARLIRQGFTYQGENYKNEEFKISCLVKTGNEKEAFIANIVENNDRNEASPIDIAHAQRRCREHYGMSDADINRLYRWNNPSKVSQYKKLLELDDQTKLEVHFGRMGVQPALALLGLPEAERAEAIEKSRRENGNVNGAKIQDIVRDHVVSDAVPPSERLAQEKAAELGVEVETETAAETAEGEETETTVSSRRTAGGVSLARNMKHVKGFFATLRESAKADKEKGRPLDRPLNNLAIAFQKYIEGDLQEDALVAALKRFRSAGSAETA
jgi:ParB/RepB/Spo0J family partition protein